MDVGKLTRRSFFGVVAAAIAGKASSALEWDIVPGVNDVVDGVGFLVPHGFPVEELAPAPRVFQNLELVEVSAVPKPINPHAFKRDDIAFVAKWRFDFDVFHDDPVLLTSELDAE